MSRSFVECRALDLKARQFEKSGKSMCMTSLKVEGKWNYKVIVSEVQVGINTRGNCASLTHVYEMQGNWKCKASGNALFF